METDITREMLKGIVDPLLIDELRQKPLGSFRLPNGKWVPPRGAWVMFLTQTILPFTRHQTKTLHRYRYLLTDKEREIVDQYARNLAWFEKSWRSMPFSFPSTPPGFEDILQD